METARINIIVSDIHPNIRFDIDAVLVVYEKNVPKDFLVDKVEFPTITLNNIVQNIREKKKQQFQNRILNVFKKEKL